MVTTPTTPSRLLLSGCVFCAIAESTERLAMSCDSRKHLKEERDAAIEQGKQVWESGAKAHAEWQAWQDGCIEAEQAAEDAQEAVAEQRALAEAWSRTSATKDALIQEGLNALDSYQVTSKFDDALALTAPAEALRAGGQEE